MHDLMVLLAHGSSDKNWAETFFVLTNTSRMKHDNVRLAFMELNPPSLSEVVRNAVQEGFTSITVLPLFLARGKHLKHDIPQQLTILENDLGITTKLLPPIGEQAEIANAIETIIDKQVSS